MRIFILNGKSTSGKDTFFEIFCEEMKEQKCVKTSIVDVPREMLRIALEKSGITSIDKDETYRKCMSDIKIVLEKNYDLNFKFLHKFIEDNNDSFIFVDMREEKDINRALNELNVKSIWIDRNVQNITSNIADANVEQFKDYDFIIDNTGDLEQLSHEVRKFIKQLNM